MTNRLIVLFLTLLLFQATGFSQNSLKLQVNQQVERIKSISGSSEMSFGELPQTSWGIDSLPKDNPLRLLSDFGMNAVPFLVPHLADDSMTQAYRIHGSGWTKQVAVNEYVFFIIQRNTDHIFAANYPGGKLDVENLQKQVLEWWNENHSKSLLERKLIEINDPIHSNRFSAYKYIGKTKSAEGRVLLEKRIEDLLIGEVNSLKQSEMADCAKSLALLGDARSTDFVRKVCNHLFYWIYMTYRPKSEGRSAPGSTQMTELFKAFQALSILGFKQESLSKLNSIKIEYFNEMETSTQKEFDKNLKIAEQW